MYCSHLIVSLSPETYYYPTKQSNYEEIIQIGQPADNGHAAGNGYDTINKIVLDGKELTVTRAWYYPDDLKKNNYDLNLDFSDGTELNIMLSGDKHDNQLIDMTKPETDPEGWHWVFDYLIYGNGDPTDPYPCEAAEQRDGRIRG